MILERFFEGKKTGFYVDVGSHHPIRFSNTNHFYLKGWRGINIDAMPGSRQIFETYRSEDINLEIAVSDTEEFLTYYMFNEPALNTFCEAEAELKSSLPNYEIIGEIKIKTHKLSSIFDEYLGGRSVDFLSIDTEGLDLKIIKSNNWQKYRPSVVLVEMLRCSLEDVYSSQLYEFMKSQKYEIVSKTFNTIFFKSTNN